MSFPRTTFVLALSLLTVSSAAAFDFEVEEPKMFEIHGQLAELILWRNDSDFDATAPYYDEEGQSVGSAISFLRPLVTYRPIKNIDLFYESELGMNQWGRNSPDSNPNSDTFMVYKHRQFWANLQLDFAYIKVGYQRVRDPSDLFLSHWMGAVSAGFDLMRFRGDFMIGQLPDNTYEGVSLLENNFMHDSMTLGIDFSYDLIMEQLTLDLGYYFLRDTSEVDKAVKLHVPYVGLAYKDDKLHARLYGLLQAGTRENRGAGGIDQGVLAWAVTANAGMVTKWVDVDLNAFVLSPDDAHDGNDQWGAFYYSGKNNSATMLFTEDEIRDRYDNLDERMSATWGSFFLNRAGLAVVDLAVKVKPMEWLKTGVVAGVGFALEEHNSLGSSFAGFEADLVVRVTVLKKADLLFAGQLFLPGGASAAFVNSTDREATEYLLGIQAGIVLDW